jgi:two-component system, OmpR family, sensor histidine kinase SenX3
MRTKGSGLGLFIVRSVARKHGGRAFAESAGQGQGSTFTLLLPSAPASV